jgi:hypothetical protein
VPPSQWGAPPLSFCPQGRGKLEMDFVVSETRFCEGPAHADLRAHTSAPGSPLSFALPLLLPTPAPVPGGSCEQFYGGARMC